MFYVIQDIGHHIPDIRLLDSNGQPDLLRDGVQGRQNAQRSGHAEPLLDTSLAEELWHHSRDPLQDGKISAAGRTPLGPR